MEEREALKRQIELLQNLINKHKSVHGDVPCARAEQGHSQPAVSTRGRGRGTSVAPHHGVAERPYAAQTQGSWKKTYSLRNKNSPPFVGRGSASFSSSSGDQCSSQLVSHSVSLSSPSRAANTATVSSGKDGAVSSVSAIREQKTPTDTSCKRAVGTATQCHEEKVSFTLEQEMRHKHTVKAETGSVVSSSEVPSSVATSTSTISQSSCKVQVKPSPTGETSTKSEVFLAPPAPPISKITLPPSALNIAANLPSQSSRAHVTTSLLKKSKFTWVKSQNAGGGSISSSTGRVLTVSPTSGSKVGAASASATSVPVSKRTPSRKLSRKLSPLSVTPKTSKYRWVSSSAGAQAKVSRKPPLAKTSPLAQRALEKSEATKKLRGPSASSIKIKKNTSSSLSSRYCWKASAGQNACGVVTAANMVGARRKSAFHWTSDKSSRAAKGAVASPSSHQRGSIPPASPGGFKLRSRMKIIRRSVTSGGAGSPSALKFSPRGRTLAVSRTPTGARRTSSRELVSFGRHKLRRLSPTSSRTSPTSSSPCGAASQRVFRTRYKMVTRQGTTHVTHYNPALSWRAKRIQSARSFLQSRLRPPHDRHPLPTAQHWRGGGGGVRWIGGSLYRVSANKLSRTAASSVSVSRTGRSPSASVSSYATSSSSWSRASNTRHLASRAVQRSLAIIRHARHKKQQRQYCMYYNRFGRCNRGNSCPYIHDPDKVAVCTRFLRGTCRAADGTCPFSHKVAKEKMPVCSYFLKGICNNSECPYSHVYVSRTAEVCEDFVRGYCPEGEKCKKKHTLLCPDFSKSGSCPRGTRCKLQHRQRVKGSSSNTSTAPARRGRSRDPVKRPRLSVVMPLSPHAAPPPTGRLELPSYISLCSSPEEADAPDVSPAATSEVKEKKLQIKPRL